LKKYGIEKSTGHQKRQLKRYFQDARSSLSSALQWQITALSGLLWLLKYCIIANFIARVIKS